MSESRPLSRSGGPIPAHILAGQERVREAGLCGELIADGTWMCIREAGHELPHGDVGPIVAPLPKFEIDSPGPLNRLQFACFKRSRLVWLGNLASTLRYWMWRLYR